MFKPCAAFCLLVLASAGVLAQSDEPPRRGWYGGLSLGRSESTAFCSAGTECEQHATAFRIFGGFHFTRYFSLELGYSNLGRLSVTSGAPVSVDAFDLTPVLSLNIDRFSLYGRPGLYTADGGVGPTLALGAAYGISARLSLRAEYQHFYDFSIFSGLEVQMFSLGARWRF